MGHEEDVAVFRNLESLLSDAIKDLGIEPPPLAFNAVCLLLLHI